MGNVNNAFDAIVIGSGIGECQKRNLCRRGCPFGGYFISNASTLPWAEKTGNLTLHANSVVQSVIYSDDKAKAIAYLYGTYCKGS